MTSDHRITPGFITDMLDVLDRHGYARGDDQHAGRAIGLIGDLARIWEGTQDHPAGTHPITVPSSLPAHPDPSSQTGRYEVVLTNGDVKTVMIALASPRTTHATASSCAPTAPTSPARHARPVSGTPRRTTAWPPG